MSMVLFHTVWTVLLVILFIGIVFWAWGRGRKQAFDEAARLPLDDDSPSGETNASGDNNHG